MAPTRSGEPIRAPASLSQKFPEGCLGNSSTVALIDDGLFASLEGRWSSVSSFYISLLPAIDSVTSLTGFRLDPNWDLIPRSDQLLQETSGGDWLKSRILSRHRSPPLVSCSSWSDRGTESQSTSGPSVSADGVSCFSVLQTLRNTNHLSRLLCSPVRLLGHFLSVPCSGELRT